MKHTLSFMVWAILAILLPLQMAQAAAPPTELQKRLQNLPDISDIKPMQSDATGWEIGSSKICPEAR